MFVTKSSPRFDPHSFSGAFLRDPRVTGTRCINELEGQPLPGHDEPWEVWIRRHFPFVCDRPFGQRHLRLWNWFESLGPGVRIRPHVEVWPRGGAKSSTAELGCVRTCIRLARRYVLYVSETQDQADKHVQGIASLLERAGVERALNLYGNAKGWKRQELRTANGFNVSAYGLDTAARGIRMDQYRPDLIIFDDIDHHSDTPRTVEKKIDGITNSIIPTGSIDCAYLFIQNLVQEDGIFAQLVDGRADFLHDREPAAMEPAVLELRTERYDRGDGQWVYRIVGGTPTWEGQDLATCEKQINEWGLRAFLREAQHEVRGASGWFFDVTALNYIDASEVPAGLRYCRPWDLAATEGGGDWTVGPLIGMSGTYPDVKVYITECEREQWNSNKVRQLITSTAARDGKAVKIHLPQDPGQAGKDQAAQFRSLLSDYDVIIQPVTGNKATRAKGFAEAVNKGNVYLVRGPWNKPFTEVLRKFKENVADQHDDDVDAASDGFNELASPPAELNFWSL